MVSIVIGGDLCPIGKSEKYFESGDSYSVFQELYETFRDADFSIVNLECPLIKKESPIEKKGPVLGASEGCINGLLNLGIDLVSLANNHILDHGEAGLINTIASCKNAGIDVVGAGSNLMEAGRLYKVVLGGIRVGVLSIAENEFSIATKYSAGANPLDIKEFVRLIHKEKCEIDFLIVLFHGGNEYYPYPSPNQVDTCRFFVELGANLVICQHSHCVGCLEHYLNGIIVYGQGNLLFEGNNRNSNWYIGILINVIIEKDYSFRLAMIPYFQSKGFLGLKKMTKEDCEKTIQQFHNRSEFIKNYDNIILKWKDYCRENKHRYLSTILGYGRIRRKINKRGFLENILLSKKAKFAMRNYIMCESHREILETIMMDITDS